MIYTLTLNPCLDYYISTKDALAIGKTNRAQFSLLQSGGKGINVSFALKNIGAESKTVVALGGKNGERIKAELEEQNLTCISFESAGESRINVKINAKGIETEINSQGSPISESEQQRIIDYFARLDENDALILAGSLPLECDADFYAKILEKTNARFTALDCTNEALRQGLKQNPVVIKPNIDELCEFFGTKISWESIPGYAKKLCDMGARYVLVSAGDSGAVLCDGKSAWKAKAPKGELVNATGAGDTMLAAFVDSFLCENSPQEALKSAVAAGSAKAFCRNFAKKEDIDELKEKITVQEVFL